MPTCAIVHCHNGSGRKERPHTDGTKATCYRIPPTEGLQKQWEEIINRKNFVVNKNTTACSLHFDSDAFVAETDNHDKYNRKRKSKTLKPRCEIFFSSRFLKTREKYTGSVSANFF